jgi:hypothetical protein
MPKGKVVQRQCPTRNFNRRHQFAARTPNWPPMIRFVERQKGVEITPLLPPKQV